MLARRRSKKRGILTKIEVAVILTIPSKEEGEEEESVLLERNVQEAEQDEQIPDASNPVEVPCRPMDLKMVGA